jgi:membrane protein
VSAIAFIWASTRLFSSLRTTLALVLDIEHERGILAGKLFDIRMTVASTLLLVAYVFINAYVAIGTTRGVQVLVAAGLREDVMGSVEYWFGRLLAFAAVVAMLFGILKYLPRRRIRSRSALLGAIVTGALLEFAKWAFAALLPRLGVGGLYTGTLAAIVIVVFWTYYAALIFLIGGEVAQVHELRLVRRQRRETFGAA